MKATWGSPSTKTPAEGTVLRTTQNIPVEWGSNPGSSPFVKISSNRVTFYAIADTGSSHTICSHTLATRILGPAMRELLKPAETTLRSATGQQLNIVGQLPMQLHFDKSIIVHTVLVVQETNFAFLLGMDLLKDTITISKGRHFLIEKADNNVKSRLPILYFPMDYVVQPKEDVQLAPYETQLISGTVHAISNQPLPNALVGQNIVVADNINADFADWLHITCTRDTVTPEGTVRCLVSNTQDAPLSIPKDTELAQAYVGSEDKHVFRIISADAGQSYFVHSEDDRDAVLHGLPEAKIPDPPGFEVDLNDLARTKKATDMAELNINPVDYDALQIHGLSTSQRGRMVKMLKEYDKVFSKGPADFGHCKEFPIKIDTGNSKPISQKYRPIPAHLTEQVKDTLDLMIKSGIIEKCDSPWNLNLVLAKKPSGALRLCLNLAPINNILRNTSNWPITHTEETLARLLQGKYFFKLDLSQAYYSLPLEDEESKQRTAFSVLGNQFRFTVAPYGLKHLPQLFNALMGKILANCQEFVVYFFDDLLAWADSPEELIERLERVLKSLLQFNVRVNWKKSFFCMTSLDSIPWLGIIIKNGRIFCDPEKTRAIREMPIPADKKAVLRFLGAVSFHRRHLKGLAEAAIPLYAVSAPKAKFEMTEKEILAFNKIKEMVAAAPSLALPDLSRPFILTTDASDEAVGVVLSQIGENGEEQIVSYNSRKFNDQEKRLAAVARELLAIMYGIASYHYYLFGKEFLLRTDCRSLYFLKTFKSVNNKLSRAAMNLAEYNFQVEHMSAKKGNTMMIADMLSRAHSAEESPQFQATYGHINHAALDRLILPDVLAERMTLAEFNEKAEPFAQRVRQQIKDVKEQGDLIGEQLDNTLFRVPRLTDSDRQEEPTKPPADAPSNPVEPLLRADNSGAGQVLLHQAKIVLKDALIPLNALRTAQMQDEKWAPIIANLTPKEANYRDPRGFFLKQGILMREMDIPKGPLKYYVLCVPACLIGDVLMQYHAKTGPHLGIHKMLLLLQRRFYWSGMARDVQNFCAECAICRYTKANRQPKAPLHREQMPTRPNEVICMDLIGPCPRSRDGKTYILSIMDMFTKYAMAVPLASKSPSGVAKALVERWIAHYGNPEKCLTDNGIEVDGHLIQYLCSYWGTLKMRTPIFAPFANPCERLNQTLKSLITTWLYGQDRRRWPVILPLVVAAYNSVPHQATGFPPREVMHGRSDEPFATPLVDTEHPALDTHEYLADIRRSQEIYFAIIRERMVRLKQSQREALGEKLKEQHHFVVGDLVLTLDRSKPKYIGDKKHAPRYEGPYRVIQSHANYLKIARLSALQEHEAAAQLPLQQQPLNLPRVQVKNVHPSTCVLYPKHFNEEDTRDRILASKFLDLLGTSDDIMPNARPDSESQSSEGGRPLPPPPAPPAPPPGPGPPPAGPGPQGGPPPPPPHNPQPPPPSSSSSSSNQSVHTPPAQHAPQQQTPADTSEDEEVAQFMQPEAAALPQAQRATGAQPQDPTATPQRRTYGQQPGPGSYRSPPRPKKHRTPIPEEELLRTPSGLTEARRMLQDAPRRALPFPEQQAEAPQPHIFHDSPDFQLYGDPSRLQIQEPRRHLPLPGRQLRRQDAALDTPAQDPTATQARRWSDDYDPTAGSLPRPSSASPILPESQEVFLDILDEARQSIHRTFQEAYVRLEHARDEHAESPNRTLADREALDRERLTPPLLEAQRPQSLPRLPTVPEEGRQEAAAVPIITAVATPPTSRPPSAAGAARRAFSPELQIRAQLTPDRASPTTLHRAPATLRSIKDAAMTAAAEDVTESLAAMDIQGAAQALETYSAAVESVEQAEQQQEQAVSNLSAQEKCIDPLPPFSGKHEESLPPDSPKPKQD
jgi:hypothetical protein